MRPPVLGPVERQRAATARQRGDGVGELPEQRGHRMPIGDQLNPAIYSPGATTDGHETAAHVDRESARRPVLRSDPRRPPVGTSEYNGLMLSPQHRAANGLFLSGKYTMSRVHLGRRQLRAAVAGIELTKPDDVAFDRGSCGATDQRHVVSLSAVYQVPGSDGGSSCPDPRLAGVGHRGRPQRQAFRCHDGRGQRAQRTGQSAAEQDIRQRLREGRAAVAESGGLPGAGGRHVRGPGNNSLVGPRRFNVDMGVTRSFRFGGEQPDPVPDEAFNVFNRVHYEDPFRRSTTATSG